MIAIKDMTLPENCDACPCRQINLSRCQIVSKSTSHTTAGKPIDQEKRPNWCPLIDMSQYEDDLK